MGTTCACTINDPFDSLNSTAWSAKAGTWSVSAGKVNVDTLTSGEAILLAGADLNIVNYSLEVTFPASSSTNKAGLAFAHGKLGGN